MTAGVVKTGRSSAMWKYSLCEIQGAQAVPRLSKKKSMHLSRRKSDTQFTNLETTQKIFSQTDLHKAEPLRTSSVRVFTFAKKPKASFCTDTIINIVRAAHNRTTCY